MSCCCCLPCRRLPDAALPSPACAGSAAAVVPTLSGVHAAAAAPAGSGAGADVPALAVPAFLHAGGAVPCLLRVRPPPAAAAAGGGDALAVLRFLEACAGSSPLSLRRQPAAAAAAAATAAVRLLGLTGATEDAAVWQASSKTRPVAAVLLSCCAPACSGVGGCTLLPLPGTGTLPLASCMSAAAGAAPRAIAAVAAAASVAPEGCATLPAPSSCFTHTWAAATPGPGAAAAAAAAAAAVLLTGPPLPRCTSACCGSNSCLMPSNWPAIVKRRR